MWSHHHLSLTLDQKQHYSYLKCRLMRKWESCGRARTLSVCLSVNIPASYLCSGLPYLHFTVVGFIFCFLRSMLQCLVTLCKVMWPSQASAGTAGPETQWAANWVLNVAQRKTSSLSQPLRSFHLLYPVMSDNCWSLSLITSSLPFSACFYLLSCPLHTLCCRYELNSLSLTVVTCLFQRCWLDRFRSVNVISKTCRWSDWMEQSSEISRASMAHGWEPKSPQSCFILRGVPSCLLRILWIEKISSCQNSVHVSISGVPPITAGFHTVLDTLSATRSSNQAATLSSASSRLPVDWVSCWKLSEMNIINPVESLNAFKPSCHMTAYEYLWWCIQ